jgi:pimeloyl-ACP methyl ester carboxylesterase
MKSWPSLTPYAKSLHLPGGDLFYYDSDSAGDADSNPPETNPVANKPALVLIHGLGDEADTWRYVFHPLAAAGYRVIAVDLPGFGRSIWKGKISMRCHLMAVIRLLTIAGIASPGLPAVFVGSSLGAAVSEFAACKRPDLVKALLLVDGCFPFEGKLEKGTLKLMLPSVGKQWYRSFRENHETAWKSLYPYYADLDAMSPEDRAFLRERVIARVESENQERGYLSTMRDMSLFFIFKRGYISRRIKTYPGKIAILWGEKDRVLQHEKTARFRGLRPDAELSIIAGAGHLPHQEKHEETLAEMLRFLKEQ